MTRIDDRTTPSPPPAPDNGEDGTRYRAPALEKGLDVLELLMASPGPLTMTEICQRLRRSQGEMFRMVQVLLARGYLEPDAAGDGFVITDRMFSMAMRRPPVLGLVEVALPVMRRLAMAIGQSCHLTLHSCGEIVVVARVESDEQIGFSVRVGHRRSMIDSVSGAVLFGFQPDDVRQRWQALLPMQDKPAHDAFMAAAAQARADGMACAVSSYTTGVTDVSAPIMRGDRATAALTVPFIHYANLRCPLGEVSRQVVAAAGMIASGLLDADGKA